MEKFMGVRLNLNLYHFNSQQVNSQTSNDIYKGDLKEARR